MYSRIDKSSDRRRAFSLIELMVVIVIIGMLTSLVVVNVRGYYQTANKKALEIQLSKICDQLEQYKGEMQRYPTMEEQLRPLVESTDSYTALLLEKDIVDPWDNPFVYSVPGPEGQPYEVISLGADGKEGGEGENRDVSHLDVIK